MLRQKSEYRVSELELSCKRSDSNEDRTVINEWYILHRQYIYCTYILEEFENYMCNKK